MINVLYLKQFYIFCIITDFIHERNALVSKVYPSLREYCRNKHGLEFQVKLYTVFGFYNILVLITIGNLFYSLRMLYKKTFVLNLQISTVLRL